MLSMLLCTHIHFMLNWLETGELRHLCEMVAISDSNTKCCHRWNLIITLASAAFPPSGIPCLGGVKSRQLLFTTNPPVNNFKRLTAASLGLSQGWGLGFKRSQRSDSTTCWHLATCYSLPTVDNPHFQVVKGKAWKPRNRIRYSQSYPPNRGGTWVFTLTR